MVVADIPVLGMKSMELWLIQCFSHVDRDGVSITLYFEVFYFRLLYVREHLEDLVH
jgi:hypothetical protein